MSKPPSRQAYAITLFLILLVCTGYFMPRWADWGANSRADLVYAIGDQGVLYIDDYQQNTGDKACFPGPYDLASDTCQGHYYTDKSIGPSMAALPFYVVFKAVAALPPIENFINSGKGLGAFSDTLNPEGEGIRANAVYEGMALTFMTFFAMAVPSALMGVVFFLLAARFINRDGYAFLLALIYGLATPAFAYSNVLYQHQMAAFGAFVGFYLLWRVIYEGANLRWLWLAGFLFSLTVVTEYPVVIALALIFLWAVYVMPNRLALYRVVLGAIPLGLIFAAYNYAIFQTPIPVGYSYSTLWQNVHDQGFLSLTVPNLGTMTNLLFGVYRGLLFLSPVLILAVPGFFIIWRRHKQRSVTVLLAGVVAYFLLFNSSSVMWWGGNTVGPRYLVPMLPFLALPIIFVLDEWLKNRLGVVAVTILVTLSALNVWIQTIGGQAFPPEVYQNPLFEYSLPNILNGDIARNYGTIVGLHGLLSLVPLLVVAGAIGFLLPGWLTRHSDRREAAALKHMEGAN
ncbi:MAG: hypothetical protein H6672_07420 [Anaerolineaceae bacterium]|nr:hypothetical protein [Anaerolineaceae bacterium]